MPVEFSPRLIADLPELTAPAAPLPLAIDQVYRELFVGIHESREFVHRDMIDMMRIVPKGELTPEAINDLYTEESKQPGFSYNEFVTRLFDFPVPTDGEHLRHEPGADLDDHARNVLQAHVNTADDGPITIGTPNEGVASGGRYSDGRKGKGIFYYWDADAIVGALDYLGLGKIADGIVENYRDQIIKFKRPPFNGNAPEYVGRFQPNIYTRLARRDVRIHGPEAWRRHLPAMLIEHAYMMQHNSVEMPDGGVLNRFLAEGYTHEDGSPRYRPESYPAVVHIVDKLRERLKREPTVQEIIDLCREDHTGAGTGTDFAGWMCADGKSLDQLRVTKRLPPFLQGLMFELECDISEALEACGYAEESQSYKRMAYNRAQTVNNTQYDEETGYYYPYDVETGLVKTPTTQDGSFMLESGMTWQERVGRVIETLRKLRRAGGLLGSLYDSNLSWDKEIWGYLQVSAAKGGWLNGEEEFENGVADSYATNVQAGRKETKGFTVERYSGEELGKPGGGGEYKPPERNFAWTDACDALLRNRAYRIEAEREAFQRRQLIARGIGVVGVATEMSPA